MYQEQIEKLKQELGEELCIMGHHYQSDSVMQHVDKVGDSLELARMIDNITAKHIVFCGVHFMAETAKLLAKDGQQVHIPDENADCVMANMTPYKLLDKVLHKLNEKTKVIPIAYVNTSLAVKAIVGKYGGAVCTSANAEKILHWALEETKKENGSVLFLPDANLAENTAHLLNIPQNLLEKIDIRKDGDLLNVDFSHSGKIIMWPGCCAVHAKILNKHVEEARKNFPNAKIVVHPECSPSVVQKSDYAGSTSFIIKLADELPEKSVLLVGTEVNLVKRLAKKHSGRIDIHSLKEVECSNMAKITEEALYHTLKAIKEEKAIPFSIDESHKENALLSIQRMLDNC